MSKDQDNQDSEDQLLEEVQSTVPSARCSQPGNEERKERVIAAWHKLAEKMVCVVRTIQKNEAALQRWTKHMRVLVYAVWIAMAIAVGCAFYLAQQAELAIHDMQLRTAASLVEMTKNQDATLNAINKLSEATALKIEADTDPSDAADAEAAAAALDAQKAALEAKKQVSDNPADKAEAERKIKKVEAKQDKGQAPLDADLY